MAFYPAGFDRGAANAAIFHLANVETSEGDFGFVIGSDGDFIDINGKTWRGSRLIQAGGVGLGLGGVAKASTATFTFVDDPLDPSPVIQQLRSLGPDYVRGRKLTFYKQPFNSQAEFYQPVFAPIAHATLLMRHLTFAAPSALVRSITVHLETAFRVRGGSENLVYNTTDHQRQIGEIDPSYEFIPVEPRLSRSIIA